MPQSTPRPMLWPCLVALLLAAHPAYAQVPPAGLEPAADENGLELEDRQPRMPPAEKIAEWFKPIHDVNTAIRPTAGALPIDASEQLFPEAQLPGEDPLRREWASISHHWAAPELYYQPPYWDRIPAERYGQTTHPLGEFVCSAFHFYGTFLLMPYKTGIDGTHDRIYTLGYYRIGSEAPPVKQQLPFQWDAFASHTGTWVGLLLLLP